MKMKSPEVLKRRQKFSLSQGAPGINETGRATKTIAPRISNKVSEEEAPRVGQSALL